MNTALARPTLSQRIEPMPLWRLYFSLQGRIPRATYWRHGLGLMVGVGLTAAALLQIAGLRADRSEAWVNLVLAWPAISLSAKRWHDCDRSAWWVLIALVPVIGWFWMLIDNGFRPGSPEVNRFGAPVRDRELGL